MKYFHRTSLPLEEVVAEADRYFSERLERAESAPKSRTFSGAIGTVRIAVESEGGHYTLVTAATDQLGESELDRLTKRFLSLVHRKVDKEHVVRGAY